jgi:hypothetical protein
MPHTDRLQNVRDASCHSREMLRPDPLADAIQRDMTPRYFSLQVRGVRITFDGSFDVSSTGSFGFADFNPNCSLQVDWQVYSYVGVIDREIAFSN